MKIKHLETMITNKYYLKKHQKVYKFRNKKSKVLNLTLRRWKNGGFDIWTYQLCVNIIIRSQLTFSCLQINILIISFAYIDFMYKYWTLTWFLPWLKISTYLWYDSITKVRVTSYVYQYSNCRARLHWMPLYRYCRCFCLSPCQSPL